MPETAVARRPLGELDGAALHRWCVRAVEELGVERGEIDALNVFPVPDGDTGTNLFQTMESAASELDRVTRATGGVVDARPELAVVVGAIARGAFLGARGNSGVILSQMLRGIAEAVTTRPGLSAVDGPILAAALERASASAYAAVGAPVEGTMLTVVRAAADAALAVRPVPAELSTWSWPRTRRRALTSPTHRTASLSCAVMASSTRAGPVWSCCSACWKSWSLESARPRRRACRTRAPTQAVAPA